MMNDRWEKTDTLTSQLYQSLALVPAGGLIPGLPASAAFEALLKRKLHGDVVGWNKIQRHYCVSWKLSKALRALVSDQIRCTVLCKGYRLVWISHLEEMHQNTKTDATTTTSGTCRMQGVVSVVSLGKNMTWTLCLILFKVVEVIFHPVYIPTFLVSYSFYRLMLSLNRAKVTVISISSSAHP